MHSKFCRFRIDFPEILQIVAFQAMMEFMANNFPDAFAGYKLDVTESHQRTKVDTSGTAKDVIGSFSKLGAPIKEVSPIHRRCSPQLNGEDLTDGLHSRFLVQCKIY